MVAPLPAEALDGPAALLAELDDGPWNEPPERRGAAVGAALHGERLDKAVVALAPEFSRNHLQTLIEAGHVRLDGAPARVASRRESIGESGRSSRPTREAISPARRSAASGRHTETGPFSVAPGRRGP